MKEETYTETLKKEWYIHAERSQIKHPLILHAMDDAFNFFTKKRREEYLELLEKIEKEKRTDNTQMNEDYMFDEGLLKAISIIKDKIK